MEESKQKVIEIYGYNGIYFKSTKEAEKFNHLFSSEAKKINTLKFFKDCDEYLSTDAEFSIERLCEEKRMFLHNEINLPFTIEFSPVGDTNGHFNTCKLDTLQEILTLVNEQLRLTNPQYVRDDVSLRLEVRDKDLKLTIKQCKALYETYRKVCDKLDNIDGAIKSIVEGGKVDKVQFEQIQKKYFLQNETPYGRLDMFEKISMSNSNKGSGTKKVNNETKAYGYGGIYFATMTEAEKYAQFFFSGRKVINKVNLFKTFDEYIGTFADDAIERLCKEKKNLEIGEIKLPFIIEYTTDKNKRTGINSCSLERLQTMITLADKKLKERYAYPREVQDKEMVKINIDSWTIEMTARQFITLYETYKNACDKLNKINGMLTSIVNRANKEEKYSQICKKLFIKEEIEEPIYCHLEMLEKDSFKDKDYLALE